MDIFSDRDETETVRHLLGDDAQSFVDVVDQVISQVIRSQAFLSCRAGAG